MKYARYFLVIILTGLLMISMTPVMFTGSETSTVTRVDYKETRISGDKINHELNQLHELSNERKEYVIFADDQTSYNQLSQLSDIVSSYPNIRAYRVNMKSSELMNLQSDISFSFQPSEAFRQAMLPIVTQSEPSQIQSDALLDAEIMGLPKMWEMGYMGQGVTVAVFDNGVDFTHPALAGKKAFERNYNTEPGGETYPIAFFHGTPVAGMIAAEGETSEGVNVTGTAPKSLIGAINIGTVGGLFLGGDFLSPWDWMAANNGSLSVVNMSWGGSPTNWEPLVHVLEERGILVVSSAGNTGPEQQTISGPGAADAALAVGASNEDNSVAQFSSRGYAYGLTIKPEVIAPGQNVISTSNGGGYTTTSGTSFSSPATAGAAAVLISALQANGMTFNPGLLKSALMRGAEALSGIDKYEGKGMVNVTASWEYIQSLELDSNNLPKSVELTPRQGPVHYLDTLPQDITHDLSLSLTTSLPDEVSISVTGDIAAFATVGTIDTSRQGQIVKLEIDTNGISLGTYTGQVTATVGNDEVVTNYEITIIEAPTYTGLIDLYHTPYDTITEIGIGSRRTGDIIKTAMLNGIWFEELNEPATDAILSNYDFFWMVRPSSFYSDNATVWNGHDLTQPVIDAITNYVEGGGNFLLNLQGYFNTVINIERDDDGTDIDQYNPLLANFGMAAEETPIDVVLTPGFSGTVSSSSSVLNRSSLSKGVNYIEHGGNYLNIIDDTRVEVVGTNRQNSSSISMATYVSEAGGRALISSSIAFFSNALYSGSQDDQQNQQFADNMINWVTSDQKINKLTGDFVSNSIVGSFQLIDNGSPGSGATVTVVGNNLVAEQSITPTSEGDGVFSFELPITSDGVYNIVAQYGDEYVKWSYTIDTTPPMIVPIDYPSETTFEPNTFKLLKFNVTDLIDTLSKSDFDLAFEEEPIVLNDFSFTPETGELRYLVAAELMVERDDPYQLEINVSDNLNNTNNYVYQFYVGEVLVTSSPEVTPPPSSSEGDEGPFPSFFAILALIVAIPIIRKRQ